MGASIAFASREAAAWAIAQAGVGGVDGEVIAAEVNGDIVVTGSEDAINALALVPAYDSAGAIAQRLADLKERRKSEIDRDAEVERLKYITAGAGQALTYQRKVEEARAAVAEDEPSPEAYPLLAASIGIDGEDVASVASTVIAMDAAWLQIGAAIETVRLSAKREIDSAEDEAAVLAVLVRWPQP